MLLIINFNLSLISKYQKVLLLNLMVLIFFSLIVFQIVDLLKVIGLYIQEFSL
jgi:hypothetical protein